MFRSFCIEHDCKNNECFWARNSAFLFINCYFEKEQKRWLIRIEFLILGSLRTTKFCRERPNLSRLRPYIPKKIDLNKNISAKLLMLFSNPRYSITDAKPMFRIVKIVKSTTDAGWKNLYICA